MMKFIRESNRIEGIHRDPTIREAEAHYDFEPTVEGLITFVGIVQPGAVLRDQAGLNVRVGSHLAPLGGPMIPKALERLLSTPLGRHEEHLRYLNLHPFTDGNGRSARALWLYRRGVAPLGFLHHFYYETLAAGDRTC